jgi:hypothetical protein
VSWVLGTINVDDPRVLDLSPPVAAAFRESTTVVTEMAMDPATAVAAGRAMLHPTPEEARREMGPDLYARAVPALEAHGQSPGTARRLRTWAAALLLNLPPPGSRPFLDQQLYREALTAGKSVTGLESLAEQLAPFRELSAQEQRRLLATTLDHFAEIQGSVPELIEAWLARDLAALRTLSATPVALSPREQALQDRLYGELVETRNRRMAARLAPRLEAGGAFVAVGALHLPGETGVLGLLERAGLGLERLY